MLCQRPVRKVPYREAYDDRMRMKNEGLWTCPCGAVVKIGNHRTVPSHRVPPADTDQATYQLSENRISELFDTLPPSRQLKLISKLSNRAGSVEHSHRSPPVTCRGIPRYAVPIDDFDYSLITANNRITP